MRTAAVFLLALCLAIPLAAPSMCVGLDATPEPMVGDISVDTMFYIDPQAGDDANDGLSPEAAWKTLETANETLRAGEGVTLLEGLYADGRIQPQNSGAPDKYILYQGEKGAQVIVRALTQRPEVGSNDAVITLDDKDYIVI